MSAARSSLTTDCAMSSCTAKMSSSSRPKALRQVGMANLEHGFRPPEVLQAMRPERLHACERWQLVAAEVVRHLGEERLAAVTRREEPRDPVERRAEIVAVAELHRARM